MTDKTREDHFVDANKKVREDFEAWAKQPPMEWDCERYTENEAWPGSYRNYPTHCAWDGYLAATQQSAARLASLEAEVMALRKDAERWKAARANPHLLYERWEPIALSPDECDEAADAAIEAERGEG